MEQSILEKILSLKEAEEFKAVVLKWERLSNNLKDSSKKIPILLPDMLWVAKSGVGKTNLLKLMSEYLESKKNLLDFYGDVKFFEFYLGYCEPNQSFTELQRLMEEVDNAAGFRSEFRGIIKINVDEWTEHYEERYFIDFMEYISANSDKWLVILSVSPDDNEKLHNFEAFISMYLRIERITINLPKTEDLFVYVEEELAAYGFDLSEDGRQLLYTTIETLRKNKYFDGFKTIKLLCQEIAYSVFTSENLTDYILTAEDLKDFAPDSEYVKRTVTNYEKANKIGFSVNGNTDRKEG